MSGAKKVGYTGNLKDDVMGKNTTMKYDFSTLRIIQQELKFETWAEEYLEEVYDGSQPDVDTDGYMNAANEGRGREHLLELLKDWPAGKEEEKEGFCNKFEEDAVQVSDAVKKLHKTG